MNREEWNNQWSNNWQQYQKNNSFRRRQPLIKSFVSGHTLDMGIGVVDIYGPQNDITGIDISDECIRLMKEKHPWGNWLVADVCNTGLPESSFDTVICSHVLEHFHDQRPIIEEMKRLVKPEGKIVIILPRRSIGLDHVHPKWWPEKIQDRVACYLKDATFELRSKDQWVIQGKKTATASIVMIAWSPNNSRLKVMVQCVKSLRTCTKYPHTWVVVDNGPLEQSEYLKTLAPDIHILNAVNQGPAVSRNTGAGAAESDYIAFVDNDVLFYDDWLGDSIELLENYPDRKLIAVPTECTVMRRGANFIAELGDCNLAKFGGSACWVMKRRSFNEIGPWLQTVPEDANYAARAVEKGYAFIYRREGQFVRHLACRDHDRTFHVGQRFVNGEWETDLGDPRNEEAKKRAVLLDYAKRFNLRHFVETGTYKGDTVKAMLLSKQFETIWSFEITEGRANKAKRRFWSFPYIHCIQGDSAELLPQALREIDGAALFWLDAHASCRQIAASGISSPVIAELKAILGHRNDHVVLIDDLRYYQDNVPNYPTLKDLKLLFPEGWTFDVKDDILRCYK